LIKVSDLHHFNVDPDPAFHFSADLDLAPHQGDANLRPLACRPSRRLRLYFEPRNFIFLYKSDPDPALKKNDADPDQKIRNWYKKPQN
jgi:hypothetical protein